MAGTAELSTKLTQDEVRHENLGKGTLYIEIREDTARGQRDTREYVEDRHEQDDSQELAEQLSDLQE